MQNLRPQTRLSPAWAGIPAPLPEKAGSAGPFADGAADAPKPGKPAMLPADPPAGKGPSKSGRDASAKPTREPTVEELVAQIGWAKVENGEFHASEDLDDQKCLDALTRLKIPWKPGPRKRGIRNPVQLDTYVLNGVYYHWYWAESNDLLLDCRMVLALYMAGPVFRKHGFDEVLYTSSYRYSYISGTRRLSRHAVGMALDVKALRGPGGVVVVVERDWHRYEGTAADCVGPLPSGPARRMRELVCDFETLPLFGGILTPDTDYDHRNHFHFGGVLPGEKWSRHRAAGRPLTRRGTAGYRYIPTLRYPLPKRPAGLPPWPAGVDPQAPMPTQGALPPSADDAEPEKPLPAPADAPPASGEDAAPQEPPPGVGPREPQKEAEPDPPRETSP